MTKFISSILVVIFISFASNLLAWQENGVAAHAPPPENAHQIDTDHSGDEKNESHHPEIEGDDHAHGDHEKGHHADAPIVYYGIAGGIALLFTVALMLFAPNLWVKCIGYLVIMGVSWTLILMEHGGNGIIRQVFGDDYVKFIWIPLLTGMVGTLNLFAVEIKSERIGGFLLLMVPLAANFGTTWSIVPFCGAVAASLRTYYPAVYKRIVCTIFAFGGNMLAIGTILADPPQALMAIKEAARGNELGFFFPLKYFWPTLIVTWILFGGILYKCGVKFGNPFTEVTIKNGFKFGVGILVIIALAVGILYCKGYWIVALLGLTLLAMIWYGFGTKFFNHKERHITLDVGVDVAFVFLAFFSVVAWSDMVSHNVEVPPALGAVQVAVLTETTDNAAAFNAGYPIYKDRSLDDQSWCNLFPSIFVAIASPIGNGPHLVYYLVFLPVMFGAMTVGRAAIQWWTNVWPLIPYSLGHTAAMVYCQLNGYDMIIAQFVSATVLGLLTYWIYPDFRGRTQKSTVSEKASMPRPNFLDEKPQKTSAVN